MNKLKEIREKKGLTLKELSDALKKNDINISPDSLAKYERGERKPKYDKWVGIATFYGVTVPYLQGIAFTKYDIYKILNDDYLSNVELTLAVVKYLTYTNIQSPESLFSKDELINFDSKVQEYWKTNFSFIFSSETVASLLYMDKHSRHSFKIDQKLIYVIDKKTLDITKTPISKAFDDITEEKEFCLKYFWLDRDEITRFASKKAINKYIDEAIKELKEFKEVLKDLPDNKQK